MQDSNLTCCVSDCCALLALRFQAERGGAAQHRGPLRLQHQADHRLWRLCGLHDPPGDPLQCVPRGSSWKPWGFLRCLGSYSCECSKLHGKVRVPAKLCWRKQQRNSKSLSVWMTMGSRGHVSITHHSLVLYSHQQLVVTALAPTLSQLWQMGPCITCSPYSDLIYRFVPWSCQMPPCQILELSCCQLPFCCCRSIPPHEAA